MIRWVGWPHACAISAHCWPRWVSIDDVDPADAEELGQAVPEIVAALERLLSGVHAGRLALAPAGGSEAGVREGWL